MRFFSCLRSLIFAVLLAVVWASLALAAPADGASRFAELQGALVHYKNWGTGDAAVVLVHGWGGRLSHWKAQQEFLVGKGRRVIALDMPGHGDGGRPEVEHDLARLAEGVRVVLKDSEVKRVVLVGHSMGFGVSALAAQGLPSKELPVKVLGVVSVDGGWRFPPNPDDQAEKQSSMAWLAALEALKKDDYKDWITKNMDIWMGPTLAADRRQEILKSVLATPQRVLTGAFASATDPAKWPKGPFATPCLAIFAAGNTSIPADNEARLRKLFPKLDYKTIDGVGHWPHMEKPEAVNGLIADFLKKVGL